MQDNFTPNIDPDWMEEGWSGMRQMLDQEMPVQHRHRFAWVWWGAALLAIGMGTGWLLKDYADHRTVIGQLPVPSEWAKAGQYPEGSVAEREVTVANRDDLEVKDTPSPIFSDAPPTAKEPQRLNTARRNFPVARSTVQFKPDAIAQDARTASPATSRDVAKPLATSNATTTIPPLKTLAALSPAPLEKQSSLSLPEQPELKVAATSSPWQPGLFISGLYGPEQGSTGYEAGFFLAWEPKASKWYSRLSISYIRLGTNQQLDERQFAFSNSRISNNPALVSSTTQVEIAHFANTAIRAGYQITPRLGLEGGFFMAYLTSARQSDVWTSAEQPGTSGGTDGSEESITALNRTNRSQSIVGLSRWNAGCTAGLRYKFSNNIFTTLNYNAPLTGLSATASQKMVLNQNIALSLFGSF